MHPVGLHLEGQVGPVVEDEGDAVVSADGSQLAGSFQERPGLELLVTQLDDVDATGDTGRHERGQIGPIP